MNDQRRFLGSTIGASRTRHHRCHLASLGLLALGLAFALGSPGSAGATALSAAHARSAAARFHPAPRWRFVPITAPRAYHRSREASAAPLVALSTLRVRFLPFHAARHAQASIAALRAAWQRGQFRHSATRPLAFAPAVARPVALSRAAVSPAQPQVRTRIYGDAVHDAIYQAAQRWGVSYSYLVRLANCESGLNPGAYNPSGASGLFQFMPSTYYGYAGRIGEGRSLWDAYASANVAAYMISVGQAHQWTCSYYI